MKKEELFDLLEDVDRKYINEAMFDDLDGDSPAVARPGKAKISPLKIFAPIAACLAVVIGTGAVVSRLNKPEQSNNSELQTTQQEIDPNAFVQVDFRDKDLGAIYNSNTIELNFELEDDLERDFIAECISIIKDEYESTQQDDVSWHVVKGYSLNYWFACYSYFFQPQIDGHGIADVGVRVFQKTKGYSSKYGETFDIRDNGGFAQGYEELDLDQVINHFDYDDKYYYYRTDTIGSGESTSLRELYIKRNEDELAEKTLLEKYVDGDTVTYLHEGKKISEEEFLGIWNTYQYIPKFYKDFTNEEVEECREALKESLGLGDDWHDCWRDSEIDIDLDGTKELLLSPQEHIDNYRERYGTYVFARTSDGIKQVGSFGTNDGDRSYCNPEEIRYRNVSSTEYFPYYPAYDYKISDSSYGSMCLVKIIPDGNGGITTELFAGFIENHIDGEWECHFEWFGEEVSEKEFNKAYYDYRDNCIDHKYHKPSVPTNPDNYAWD